MFLNHVQTRNIASSISLLPLKVSFEKIILSLCCQIVHVCVTHQQFHLLTFIPASSPCTCWRKCCLGFCGKEPEMFTQDKDSHHIGRVLVKLKNRWVASSSFLQNGNNRSLISTCLLRKFNFVGSRSLINLHAKKDVLLGIFKLHNSSKIPSWFSSIDSPISRL